MRIDAYSLSLQSAYTSTENTLTRVTQKGEMIHTQYVHDEKEHLSLHAQGMVTWDNGSAFFDMSASRERAEVYQTQRLVHQNAIDPLVVNLTAEIVGLQTHQRFRFDLDSDGHTEEIALLLEGNAFLAYDRNHNGKIDDGSELFGTQSGDGFADLRAWDEDANGVIDENDSVFEALRLWHKTSRSDTLIRLDQAKVGALLLDNITSPFSEKKADTVAGYLHSSGVVILEDGTTSWMSHVNFVIPQETNDIQETFGIQPMLVKQPTLGTQASTQETLVSALEKRLAALEARLSKTHDRAQKEALSLQILSLCQQISLLKMG